MIKRFRNIDHLGARYAQRNKAPLPLIGRFLAHHFRHQLVQQVTIGLPLCFVFQARVGDPFRMAEGCAGFGPELAGDTEYEPAVVAGEEGAVIVRPPRLDR